MVIVCVVVFSDSVIFEPADKVTVFDPLVFDWIRLVVPVPAPTVRLPSLLTLPSTSVAVSVIVPPFVPVVSVTARMPPPEIITSLPPLVFVVMVAALPTPAPTPIRPSLLTLPSTSVPVTVKFG